VSEGNPIAGGSYVGQSVESQRHIQDLRQRLIERSALDANELERRLEEFASTGVMPQRDLTRRIAHRMVGAAAILGFPDLSAAAEKLMNAIGSETEAEPVRIAYAIKTLIEAIRSLSP
jgi:HPt (histidine-containing phosphotransfer) domain-containing protein